MNIESSDSQLDLGEPDLSSLRHDVSLVPIKMIEEDFFWSQYCQGVGIGSTISYDTYNWTIYDDDYYPD